MEGKIVAAYKTPYGICYFSDAAYAGRSDEDLQRVEREVSSTVQTILRDIAREGGDRYRQLLEQIERRKRGLIDSEAVEIPVPLSGGEGADPPRAPGGRLYRDRPAQSGRPDGAADLPDGSV